VRYREIESHHEMQYFAENPKGANADTTDVVSKDCHTNISRRQVAHPVLTARLEGDDDTGENACVTAELAEGFAEAEGGGRSSNLCKAARNWLPMARFRSAT
jgi:hypothetical protein